MLALVLRGFLQRKVRVLLTAIAIALGVALMAGTYILTDTIDHSFAGIFSTAYKGDSVDVSPAEPLRREIHSPTSPIHERPLLRGYLQPRLQGRFRGRQPRRNPGPRNPVGERADHRTDARPGALVS